MEVVKNIKIATVYKYFVLIFLIFAACSQVQFQKICKTKVSPQLNDELNTSKEDIFNIVIYLSDSTNLRSEYPFLDDVSATVATGRLTKTEIMDLCKSIKITYIDLSKRRYPTKKL